MPGRGFTSTVTVCPLSGKAPAEKVRRAKTMFSGGPWRSTMVRALPAEKLTEVSEGGGPEVSSTITRFNGRTRAAVGTAGAATAGGRCEPQPQPKMAGSSQVAGLLRLRDIARTGDVGPGKAARPSPECKR